MRKIKKIVLLSLITLSLIFITVIFYLYSTKPKMEGTCKIEGISESVSIERDEWGIPHILAKNVDDLFFAVGFVHAQDRLFQMDLSRRLATGRLAEIFGRPALDSDTLHKDLMIEEAIENSMEYIDDETLRYLVQYSRGINHVISNYALPPEFGLLGYKPEPWDVRSTAAIFKNMELILSGSGQELLHLKLQSSLGAEKAQQLWRVPVKNPIVTSGQLSGPLINGPFQALLGLEVLQRESQVGSNNWVVGGARSATGKPLLANDPHLANVFPSYFYQIIASCPQVGLSGNTIPGTPFVIIGRNRNLGWGFTNTGTDIIDYFQLQINPSNKAQYRYDQKWLNFEYVDQSITVKNSTITRRIKTSILGPVIEHSGLVLARHSLSLYRTTVFTAFRIMNFSRTVEEFLSGIKLFSSPAQNILFADRIGNIGYFPSGWIPRRGKGNGSLPVEVTCSEEAWQGFHPEEKKPLLLNPDSHFIATANNPPLADDSDNLFGVDGFADPAFRADRIRELLLTKKILTIQDMITIQTDSLHKGAQFIIPMIADLPIASSNARHVLDILKEWDHTMRKGLAPYLFTRFEKHLADAVFADHLPPEDQSLVSTAWLYRLLNYPVGSGNPATQTAWLDDVRTASRENLTDMVEQSLQATFQDLEGGGNKRSLAWENLHRLRYRHPLGRLPILRSLLNRGPYIIEGGNRCILKTHVNEQYEINWLSAFRMILDFNDFSGSLLINSSGQSGHFLSRHYDDQIVPYVNKQYRPMESPIKKRRHLLLQPAR